MERSAPGRMFMLFLSGFMVLMILIPLIYPHGSFTGLDGRAGVIENWDSLSHADPVTRAVYFLGDLFCHQEESRSFIINGSQMAFCHRDTSILLGVILGLAAADEAIGKIYAGNKLLVYAGAVMILSTAAEWAAEYISGYDLLAARVATGVLAGIGIALILQYAVTNQYEKIMKFE
ncbi:MAG: DUF2085 domain-containing protein [Candidatus Methanoplasma sp.]|jgi:uncharacterized membrane protein|nr:DUF2085 domain-containing protein [Candidatus Methanoplasma sp.]